MRLTLGRVFHMGVVTVGVVGSRAAIINQTCAVELGQD